MNIQELKALSLTARKNKNKKAATTYQVVIGELERVTKEATPEQIFAVARKLIKAAEMFPVPDQEEISILKGLLPKEVSDEELLQLAGTVNSIQEFMKILPQGTDKSRASKLWNSR